MLYHFYIITNTRTGKVYVGKTLDTPSRFAVHRSELRLGKHSNHELQADYTADPTCWEYSIIESVELESQHAKKVEADWINAFPEAYNYILRRGRNRSRMRNHKISVALSKPCTIDGVVIYPSKSKMIEALGQSRNGTGHPNFRYI